MAAREQGESEGRIYELGGPAVYSFRALLRLLLEEIGRRRLLLPIPFPLAAVLGAMLQYLPGAPLTLDQVRLLRQDNVVSPSAASFATLGLRPVAIETVLPTYLASYRRRAARG